MIIALEDAKYKLIAMRADVEDLGSALRIEQLKATAKELDEQTLDPDFWSNQENSSTVLQKLKQTKDTIENYEALKNRLEDAITLAEMAIEENEEAYVEEVESELAAITKAAENKRIEILLSGKEARHFASQGQQRSIVLAMKNAEGEVCYKMTGERAVYLLDDVLSELDESRQRFLLTQHRDTQVIISSCTRPTALSECASVIEVSKGEYRVSSCR